MPLRDRPVEVLPTSEARRALPKTLRDFDEQGADAQPVFIGAHRKPAGVMLSYARYVRLLEQLDDLSIALEIKKRDRDDAGERLTLDELFTKLGLDRATIADQPSNDDLREPGDLS